MKMKLLGLAVFGATAGAIALYPYAKSVAVPAATPPATIHPAVPMVGGPQIEQAADIEVVFVLDTTGSMGGLIEAAKEKIWSIATTLASAQQSPTIRMGLVAYRDRGDEYVTRVTDLSEDLDTVYATLMDYRAQGGGDGPESVNAGLNDAVNKMSWSKSPNTYRVVFLVGDAPAHMDYPDEPRYHDIIGDAKQLGIVINAIQCGGSGATKRHWLEIAQLGAGEYFRVDPDGSAVAIATPYDKELATLSEKLDGTRAYYGTTEEKKSKAEKVRAATRVHEDATLSSRARRAAFNASKSGKANAIGRGDLVDDVATGRIELEEVGHTALPASLQGLSMDELKRHVGETAAARKELTRQMRKLAEQRDRYLADEVMRQGGAKDSLDQRLFDAVRDQAGKLGIDYDGGGPRY